MQRRTKRMISWIALLGWMVFIFIMSNQVAEVSSNQSNFVLEMIKNVGVHIEEVNFDVVTTIIRKAAHVTEYLILYLLGYNVVRFYVKGTKGRIMAFIFIVLYAMSDEFHQTFVQGRSGEFKDVCIDSIGGIIGIIGSTLKEKVRGNR